MIDKINFRDNDNLTIKLLNMLGSPFSDESTFVPQNEKELFDLYKFAIKNKLDMFYLEHFRQHEYNDFFKLKYDFRRNDRKNILTTAHRICKFLNELGIEYAVIKSLLPFPYIPNDIDIIIFNDENKFRELLYKIKEGEHGFKYELIGEAPLEVMIHDNRDCKHENPKEKDVYDVDLYKELGASHIIYIDKNKIKEYVTETYICNEKIKILKPEAELAVLLVHSVYPEMIFTLHLYYATLFYLSGMSSREITEFVKIIDNNKINNAVKYSLSVVAYLHNLAHGFIPDKINKIVPELVTFQETLQMPYKYEIPMVISTISEKMKERKAAISMLRQFMYSLNPKNMIYLSKVIIERRRRDTY